MPKSKKINTLVKDQRVSIHSLDTVFAKYLSVYSASYGNTKGSIKKADFLSKLKNQDLIRIGNTIFMNANVKSWRVKV